ncbi:MAG: hypothetical protein C0524_02035 [Rhodobacter sp.]|nr:hypothetical protein [Rhodobacter sp.]
MTSWGRCTARFDYTAILPGDFWSHKTHVTRDNRSGKVTVAIEGENKGSYPKGMPPEWVAYAGTATTTDLGTGHIMTHDDAGARFAVPGHGIIDIRREDGKPRADRARAAFRLDLGGAISCRLAICALAPVASSSSSVGPTG